MKKKKEITAKQIIEECDKKPDFNWKEMWNKFDSELEKEFKNNGL